MAPEITVVCEECGQHFDAQVPGACPQCGNGSRVFNVIARDFVSVIEKVKGTVTEPEIKGWSKEVEAGEEHYKEANEIRTVIRIKDRKNRYEPGSYYEQITNWHTKDLIKLVSGRFVDHQGHGSAKKKIPEFPEEWRRVAAYYIWEKEGRPNGRHINHWNKAKSHLRKLWKEGSLPRID